MNACDQQGRDPLAWAAQADRDASDVLRALLDNHAAINHSRDMQGYTPLMWAAEKGHSDSCHLLLSNHKRSQALGIPTEKCERKKRSRWDGADDCGKWGQLCGAYHRNV